MTLSITMLGEDKFIRAFNRIGDEVKNFEEPFGEIYADFTEINRAAFEAEGPGWKPLSPRYAAWKLRNFGPLPIMVLSGELKASLAVAYGIDPGAFRGMGEHAIREIHAMDAYFGTSLPYAARHQYGDDVMPQRKLVDISESDKVRWGRIVHTWAVKKLRAATVEGGAAPA